MKGYKTSKDYKRLRQLLDDGHKVICIGPDDNIGFAEYDGGSYVFGGSWVMEFYNHFEENCADEAIEFIDPTDSDCDDIDERLLNASKSLVESVEKYIQPKKGEFLSRIELLVVLRKVKKIIYEGK